MKADVGGERLQLYYVNCWGNDNLHVKVNKKNISYTFDPFKKGTSITFFLSLKRESVIFKIIMAVVCYTDEENL